MVPCATAVIHCLELLPLLQSRYYCTYNNRRKHTDLSPLCNVWLSLLFKQTEVCEKIIAGLSQEGDESFSRKVSIVSQDCFYKSLDPSEKAEADKGEYNFDHPGEIYAVYLVCT